MLLICLQGERLAHLPPLAFLQTVSSLLGPHTAPVKYDDATSRVGSIQISGSTNGWIGDGSTDGDAVFAPVFDAPLAARATVPALTCSALPSLFSIEAVLSPYAAIPFVGITSFTGTAGADSSISASGGGYGFFAPVNMSESCCTPLRSSRADPVLQQPTPRPTEARFRRSALPTEERVPSGRSTAPPSSSPPRGPVLMDPRSLSPLSRGARMASSPLETTMPSRLPSPRRALPW